MKISIKGLDKTLKNFDKRAKADLANTIVNKGATIVEGAAKRLSPVDTGTLRRSILTTKSDGRQKAEAAVSTSVEYGIYQEFGTVRQKAQPFMHPAARQSKSKIDKLAKNEIQKAMRV